MSGRTGKEEQTEAELLFPSPNSWLPGPEGGWETGEICIPKAEASKQSKLLESSTFFSSTCLVGLILIALCLFLYSE